MLKKILYIILVAIFFLLIFVSNYGKDSSDMALSNEIDKYNTYIALQNYMINSFTKILANYFQEFGNEEEILIKPNFSGFSSLPVLENDKKKYGKNIRINYKKTVL